MQSSYSACSAIIVRDVDNKVFVAQRKMTKSFGAGLWETIGGGVEPEDESLSACMKREIREELGVEVSDLKEFRDYRVDAGENGEFLIKVFIVKLAGEPQPNSADFETAGWLSRPEIEKLEFVSNCKQRLLDYFDA